MGKKDVAVLHIWTVMGYGEVKGKERDRGGVRKIYEMDNGAR